MPYLAPARAIRPAVAAPVAAAERVDLPRPGFYRARRSAAHPWRPVAIFLPCPLDLHGGGAHERPRVLCATIGGRWVDPDRIWSWCAGNPITAAEFDYLVYLGRTPGQPEAEPDRPIDLGQLPPLYQRRA